jgi:methylenetetrahydrofolate dehydrogenase (NADP+)/methenyltetrahydrofolate cyclohydrolase
MPVMHKARIIDGAALAERVKREVALRVQRLRDRGRAVRLDALLVGAGAAASVYARHQGRACDELGIEYHLHELAAGSSHDDVERTVKRLGEDPTVRAIMVHLPLPEGVDTPRIQSLIAVNKDVEGVNPANIGKIVYGGRSLVPCTALAVMEMIESAGTILRGTRCVCVGASDIVGKPVAVLLMQAEATVISTNKYTPRIEELTRSGDVLVSATGVPGLVRAHMVKPGAVVIDVGVARVRDPATGRERLAGDVMFEEVSAVAGWISPVPGGVGPLTVAMLLRNTVDAAEQA